MTIDDWRVRYDGFNAEADRLRAEVERLREDAARALWCEEMKADVTWSQSAQRWRVLWDSEIQGMRHVYHPDRNAAIDAARGKA
jgi:hypothetical protein